MLIRHFLVREPVLLCDTEHSLLLEKTFLLDKNTGILKRSLDDAIL